MPLMPLLRSVGRALTAPFRRTSAGMVLGSDPPPRVLRAPAPASPDDMALARRNVEKVRSAVFAGRMQFLPFWDNLTEETPEIRRQYPLMLREPVLKAALGTKVLAVASLPAQVHAADADDARSRAAADAFKHALERIGRGSRVGFTGTRKLAWNLLAPLVVNGWSFSECAWEEQPERLGKYAGKLLYRDFKSKDTRYLWPLVDEFKNVVGYRAGAYNAGHTFEGRELRDFVCAAHFSFHENPLGMSDFRAPYRFYWLKITALELWGLNLEKWAKGPFLKGTYGHSDRKALLEQSLSDAQGNSWVTVPQGDLVEVMDTAMRGTADFQAFVDYCDKQMLIATMGSYLQILEGQTPDGRGDTQVQKEQGELFTWALAALAGDVVTAQMAPAWTEVNYAGVEPPTVTWGSVSEEEMSARQRVDEGLQKIGLKLSEKEAYAFYGRQRPVDENDILKPDKGGGESPPGAGPGGEGGPGPGGPTSPFDGAADAGAAFSEDHWHEAAVLCYAEGSAAHKAGDVWKGPSGRWFTRRQDGRIVPAKNPNAEAKKAAPAKKATASEGEPKPTLDGLHAEVEAARKEGLTPEKIGALGKRLAEHLTCKQIEDLKKRLGAGFAGKGGVGAGPKQALADRIAARAAELAAASEKAAKGKGADKAAAAAPTPAAPAAPPSPRSVADRYAGASGWEKSGADRVRMLDTTRPVDPGAVVDALKNYAQGRHLSHDIGQTVDRLGRAHLAKLDAAGVEQVAKVVEPDLRSPDRRGDVPPAVQDFLRERAPDHYLFTSDQGDTTVGAALGPSPPSPGFTGFDANGHQWVNGVQVARQEEPAKPKQAAAPAPAPQPQPAAPAKAKGDPRALTPKQLAAGKFSAAKGIDAGIHEKAVGKVTVDGQAYFWKGTGKDNAENNTLTAELCAAAGVATPACRLANVPGAPNEFPGEGGLLTEWVEAPTYAKLSLTPKGDKKPIAGLLHPGEAQKAALLSYLLGMKDRHGGNYLVKDKRLVSIDHDGALWDGGAEAESFDTGGEADTAMDALASEPFLREITEGATPGKPVDRRAARFDPAIVREMAGHAGRLSAKLAGAGRQRSAEVVARLGGVLKELASGDATWGRLEALTRTALPE